MSEPLSIVLTVCNAERTLADQLDEVFEILADLSDCFEVLVVDEGSVDHTDEVGHELALVYPQLRFYRRSRDESVGQLAADSARDGGTAAAGAAVFLHGGHLPIRPSHLRRLCEQRVSAR